MRDLKNHPELCAINTATFGHQASLSETVEAIAKAGFGGIAPWRREVEGQDVKAIAKHIRDAGLKVTGYCRSTYIPTPTKDEFLANIADNIAALNDTAVLGADSFVMVVGTLANLVSARSQVQDGVGLLAQHAETLGVKLALEPLHPVYAGDRSCINLISQALDICDAVGSTKVGVFVDAYHVWWDPNVARDIARAGAEKRIFGFHVSDWLMPITDTLNDRGMMGDGVIDLKSLRAMAEAAGYDGLTEVEIFSSANWWKRPMAETLQVIKERLGTVV
jgi:sugar phosphate isomerase/epimerase